MGWVSGKMSCVFSSHRYDCAWHFILTIPPTPSNLLSVQFCCYYDPEKKTRWFYSRRGRRKVIVNLSLSFLTITPFFPVAFDSTEWRSWTCCLVILARKVTLHLWSLTAASGLNLKGVGGERARRLNRYNSQGQKADKSQSQSQNCVQLVRELSAMMAIDDDDIRRCHEHHDSHSGTRSLVLACKSRQSHDTCCSAGNRGKLSALFILTAVTQKSKPSPPSSLWWHNGEKVKRTRKLWACNGFQTPQNDGKKTSNL